MTHYFVEHQKTLKQTKHLKPQNLTLSKLSYSHNHMIQIPHQIKNYPLLRILDLSHNKISKLEHIFNLSKLQSLNVGYNLIDYVGKEIKTMINLRKIDLTNNSIGYECNLTGIKFLNQQMLEKKKKSLQVSLWGNPLWEKSGQRKKVIEWLKISETLSAFGNSIFVKTEGEHNIDLVNYETNSHFHKKQYQNFCPTQKLKNQQQQQQQQKQEKSQNKQDQFLEHQICQQKNIINDGCSALIRFKQTTVKQMMGYMDEINKNLQLIVQSEWINYISQETSQIIKKSTKTVQQIIERNQELISGVMKLQVDIFATLEGYEEVMSQLDLNVKSNHLKIVSYFRSNVSICIDHYWAWVAQYRKLKQLGGQMVKGILELNYRLGREKRLIDITSISPPKQGRQESTQLQTLLFSQTQDNVMNSQQNDAKFPEMTSNKQHTITSNRILHPTSNQFLNMAKNKFIDINCQNCNGCLLKGQSIVQMKNQINILTQQNSNLSLKNKQCCKENLQMKHYIGQHNQTMQFQKKIISDLQEKINTSTYQSVMLGQAKTIQSMIRFNDSFLPNDIDCFKKLITQQKLRRSLKQTSQKTNEITKRILQQKAIEISQFIVPSEHKQKNNSTKSISYFEHKVKLSGQEIKNTQQKRTQSNMHYLTSKTIHHNSNEETLTVDLNEKTGKRKLLKREDLEPITPNYKLTSIKNIQDNFDGPKEEEEEQDKHHKTLKLDYCSAQVQHGINYKNYIKHHLRNNILSILDKKKNYQNDRSNPHKRQNRQNRPNSCLKLINYQQSARNHKVTERRTYIKNTK